MSIDFKVFLIESSRAVSGQRQPSPWHVTCAADECLPRIIADPKVKDRHWMGRWRGHELQEPKWTSKMYVSDRSVSCLNNIGLYWQMFVLVDNIMLCSEQSVNEWLNMVEWSQVQGRRILSHFIWRSERPKAEEDDIKIKTLCVLLTHPPTHTNVRTHTQTEHN